MREARSDETSITAPLVPHRYAVLRGHDFHLRRAGQRPPGRSARKALEELARQFGFSRNTVRSLIAQKGQMPQSQRSDKKHIDPELLRELWSQCRGRIQRMHEILTEEKGCQVSYPTLTRMLSIGYKTSAPFEKQLLKLN